MTGPVGAISSIGELGGLGSKKEESAMETEREFTDGSTAAREL
jgi:hypothetical protein